MSDTIFTPVNPDAWTQVSVGLVGYVTNAGDQDVIYVEATSTPDVSVEIGHTLHPKEARTYNLLLGQQMYVRTMQTIFPVVITPGLGFGELGPFTGNIEETVLASMARTATTTSADIINANAKGAHFVIDVSAIGIAPQITVTIQGKDISSGNYYDILISTTYNIVDTFILKVYPGLSDAQNLVAGDVLPNTFRVLVTHGNADSITYSVSVLYIV